MEEQVLRGSATGYDTRADLIGFFRHLIPSSFKMAGNCGFIPLAQEGPAYGIGQLLFLMRRNEETVTGCD